jgi:3-oxoacyl-[acyl-carrier protein] reductase
VEVAAAIRDAGGVADPFIGDVTDERQVDDLVAAVAAALGPVSVLVVNATGAQPEAPLEDVPWDEYLAQLEFFVKSPVLVGRAVLPGMRARRSGRIVQIDSEVADRPPAGRSAYAAPPRTRRSGSLAPGRANWRRWASPSIRWRRASYRSSATPA